MTSLLLLIVSKFIEVYAKAIYDICKSLGFEIAVLAPPQDERLIAKRIERLDEARDALSEGLRAIDELKEDARIAKEDYEKTLASLDSILKSKEDAEQKLASVQGLLDRDVGAMRTVIGIGNINRERLIGFGSGIAASVIASGIVWAIVAVAKALPF